MTTGQKPPHAHRRSQRVGVSLSADEIREIRRLRFEEKLSVHRISKETGHTHATVARYTAVPPDMGGDDPDIAPPAGPSTDKAKAMARALQRLQVNLPRVVAGDLARERVLLEFLTELGEIDPAMAQVLAPDPGEEYDPLSIARRMSWDPRTAAETRLKAVKIYLDERRSRIRDALATSEGSIEWSTFALEQVPTEHRGRVAGILLHELLLDRAPQFAQPATSPAQMEVWYLTGEHVAEDLAQQMLAVLRPAIGQAKDLAAAARAALVPQPDPTPVWQDNPLVPQG